MFFLHELLLEEVHPVVGGDGEDLHRVLPLVVQAPQLGKLPLTHGRCAIDELQQHQAVLVIRQADVLAVTVFQSELGCIGARGKTTVFRKEITDDGLVLGMFRLALDIIEVVLGQTARAAVAIAEFLQVKDGDELGKLRVPRHERVAVEVFLEGARAFVEGIIQQVAVVGRAVEVAVKQLLEEVDIGALGVEHRLPVEVVLDDFPAAVGADTQTDSCYLVAVLVLHVVRLDVGHLATDGILDGVDVA